MYLETLLPAIRSLHDLTGLVAALGHQPLWDEVPAESLTVVGRTGGLPWFAIESGCPERAAERLARRMCRRGRMCLVLALDPRGSRLAVAVGFGSCPHLEVDLTSPSAETLASLARLTATEEGTLAFAARAADALAAETVGRRFFRAFRATVDRVAAGLPGPMPAEDRHGLALLQLTRILFLYFIQTKGWLGGRERFLAEEVEKCLARKRRLHRDLLRPLFFGTLNRPRDERSRAAASFGPIPFLNGGLFEPHPLERRFRADIPNPLWRDAFDQLFERFHFTVVEGQGHGGIAPDMLGRVFEGVMAPELRHASGTFYTPAALVGSVLDAALISLIAERLRCGEREADRRFRSRDPEAARILTSITVLDPAVGSGAFLLGALDRLSALGHGALSGRRRRVLQQNLFGVDLSTAAVRLSELRLWLAVVADDPAECPADVAPLPNLDCLIRQGDSLFDPIGHGIGPLPHDSQLVTELSQLRRAVITASGADKRALIRRLRSVEARAVGASLTAAESRARSEVDECLREARTRDLFDRARGLDGELLTRLTEQRGRLRSLRQARRRLTREGELPWFHYQSHFADVFARGGFDLVAGNPPWLRSGGIPPPMRARLAGRYRWWRTTAGGYGNRPDLAVAFVERSLELTAPGGVVAMLVPAKIAGAGYGTTARHSLASSTTLHAIANLTGRAGAEFDATVYPMALIAGKTTPPPGHRVRTTLAVTDEPGIRQSRLVGGAPWILVTDRLGSLLETLATDHPALGERFVCHLGLKTGANQVFLSPPEDLEPEVLRWAVRGRDVTSFRCLPKTRLLWTHDAEGRPRSKLPPRCTAYLARHRAELQSRRDYAGGPAWTVFRVRPAIARYRVVWPDLGRQLTASALTTRNDLCQIPLNSCYVAPTRTLPEAERLTVCLNSTWLRAVARLGAVPAASGFARFNAQTVARLPLPHSALADPTLSRLAQEGRDGTLTQEELDAAVAGHLGLSSDAQNALRAVVDGAANHSR